ncbi:MAG: preprotein translocase subunit SecG [Alphaproteobacteria bacterium]|nr:preprotein translocase subunit SecG [Alphaproteobacteria bacterium]
MGLVVLTIHLVVCVCLIGLVLLQRSEGGALGMGGGGGGALMSGRGAADALAKMTSVAGGFFIVTSLTLTMLSGAASTGGRSVMDLLPTTQSAPTTTTPATTETPPAPATTPDPTEGRIETPTQLVSLGPSEAAAATPPPPAAATTRAGPIENRTIQQAAATQRQVTPASVGATIQRTTPTTTPQRSAPQTTPASTQPVRQAPAPATTGNAVGGIDLTTDNQLTTESSNSANDSVAAVRRERAGPDQ